MPRIIKQLAVNIPVMQYDENMFFPSETKSTKINQHNEQIQARAQILSDLMIEQAKEKAQEILNNAKLEAQTLIEQSKQDFLKQVEIEKKQIFNEASKNGFDEGVSKGFVQGEVQAKQVYQNKLIETQKKISNDLKNAFIELDNYKETLNQDSKRIVVDIVTMACKKILSEKIDKDDKLLLKLIKNGLKDSQRCRTIKIKVNSKYFEIISNNNATFAQELSEFSDNIVIEEIDKLGNEKCYVECDDTIIDVSIDVQVENIKDIIKSQLV